MPNGDGVDDPLYHELRQKAHLEAEKRNELYEQSHKAYLAGDGGKGSFLWPVSLTLNSDAINPVELRVRPSQGTIKRRPRA